MSSPGDRSISITHPFVPPPLKGKPMLKTSLLATLGLAVAVSAAHADGPFGRVFPGFDAPHTPALGRMFDMCEMMGGNCDAIPFDGELVLELDDDDGKLRPAYPELFAFREAPDVRPWFAPSWLFGFRAPLPEPHPAPLVRPWWTF